MKTSAITAFLTYLIFGTLSTHAVAEQIESTPTRPQLTNAQAANYSYDEVLKYTGVSGALTVDPWDPLADEVMAGNERPQFQYTVDPAAANGVTVFATVQAAINKVVTDVGGVAGAAQNRVYIRVVPGDYNEVVYVPAIKTPITLWGDAHNKTGPVRVYFNIDQGMPSNGPTSPYATLLGPIFTAATTHPDITAMYNSCNNKATIGTGCSAVMWVKNGGFQLKDMTVENSYDEGRGGTGLPHQSSGNHQAVAFQADGADKTHIDGARFIGNQDTLYLKSSAAGRTIRVFVNKSYVEGDVDFIFGRATAYFRKSEIRWVGAERNAASGFITAPSTNYNTPYGFVFYDCDFTSDGAGLASTASVTFGRQWFEGARCSPYSITQNNGTLNCAIDPTNTVVENTSNTRLVTIETVGKAVILKSQIGDHIRRAAPWSDWNTNLANVAYRLVQYNSDDYWNNLVKKNPTTLYPSGQKVPVEPFLGEYKNKGPGASPF